MMKAVIRFNTRSRKAVLSSVNKASVAKKQENALSDIEDETLMSSSLSSSFSSSSSSRDSVSYANLFQCQFDEVQSSNGETEQDVEAAATVLPRSSNLINDDDELQASQQVIEDRLRHRINELQDELTRRIERTNKLRTSISSIDSDDDDDDDEQVSKSMKGLEANEDELRERIVELKKELAQRLLLTASTDHPSVDGSELLSDDSVVVLTESIDNSKWQEVNLWDEDDDDQSADSSVVHSNNKTGICTQCEYVGMWTEFDMSADNNTSEEEDTTIGMWAEVDMTVTPPTCESSSTDDNNLSSTKKELANNSSSPVKLAWVSEERPVVCVEALAA